MKRFQSILCTSLLTVAISSTAFAGNISGVHTNGNISGKQSAGNISGVTSTGNISGIKTSGNISGVANSGNIAGIASAGDITGLIADVIADRDHPPGLSVTVNLNGGRSSQLASRSFNLAENRSKRSLSWAGACRRTKYG
jgi:hypothetical protein